MANEVARKLRKSMTVDETKLWQELRELRRQGMHFRRQAPIGRYIVDFACLSKRLVIEVDGVQHQAPEGRTKDAVRDAWLQGQGFTVLRFTNGEVTETRDGVMLEIMAAVGLVERP
jgi:very-short-patch-repair endonuclease